MTAQEIMEGMPPKTHRTVRISGFQGNVAQTLKEIQSLPQVATAIVSTHTKEVVYFHITTK